MEAFPIFPTVGEPVYFSYYLGVWYYSPENQKMLKALYEMDQRDAESN